MAQLHSAKMTLLKNVLSVASMIHQRYSNIIAWQIHFCLFVQFTNSFMTNGSLSHKQRLIGAGFFTIILIYVRLLVVSET